MYVLVLLKKRYNPIEISDLLDELNAWLEMIGGKTKVLMSTIKKTTAQIAGKTITNVFSFCYPPFHCIEFFSVLTHRFQAVSGY